MFINSSEVLLFLRQAEGLWVGAADIQILRNNSVYTVTAFSVILSPLLYVY